MCVTRFDPGSRRIQARRKIRSDKLLREGARRNCISLRSDAFATDNVVLINRKGME